MSQGLGKIKNTALDIEGKTGPYKKSAAYKGDESIAGVTDDDASFFGITQNSSPRKRLISQGKPVWEKSKTKLKRLRNKFSLKK